MNSPEAILLLVEDDPSDVLFFERALTKAGGDVPLRVARDGNEAVAYLAGQGVAADRGQHPLPLLVVLDLKLPYRSGFEVLEWLRKEPIFKDLPVIVLTSSREPSDLSRAKALGVDAYEVKPVHFPDLLSIVTSIRARWWALAQAKVGRRS